MPSYYTPDGAALLRHFEFIPSAAAASLSSEKSTCCNRLPLDAVSLIDLVLHINSCYSLFFWELRRRAKEDTRYVSPCSSEGHPIPSTHEDSAPLALTFNTLQASHDSFTVNLGREVVGPVLFRCLTLYLDSAFETSAVRREVQSLLLDGRSPYCVEPEENVEETQQGHHLSNTGDEGEDSEEAAGRSLLEQRRWQRLRATIHTAPPPTSNVAPLLLAIGKALLSVHKRTGVSALPWLYTHPPPAASGRAAADCLKAPRGEGHIDAQRATTPRAPWAAMLAGVVFTLRPTEDARSRVVVPQSGEGLVLSLANPSLYAAGLPAPLPHWRRPPMRLVLPRGRLLRCPFAAAARKRPRPTGLINVRGWRCSDSLLGPLPRELLQSVLLFVPPRYTRVLAAVCRTWRQLALDSATLHAYLLASRAVTEAYVAFHRDDWGEKLLRCTTFTTVHRLQTLQVPRTVATVLEPLYTELVRDGLLVSALQPQQASAKVASLTQPTTVRGDRASPPPPLTPLPVHLFVSYVLTHFPPGQLLHRTLCNVLDAISDNVKERVLLPYPTPLPARNSKLLEESGGVARCLLHQRVMLSLLLDDGNGLRRRTPHLLTHLLMHWTAVRTVYEAYLLGDTSREHFASEEERNG